MHSFYDFLAGLFLLDLFIVNLICLIVLPIAIIRHLFFPPKGQGGQKRWSGCNDLPQRQLRANRSLRTQPSIDL
jgi:hypothetical protein